MENKKEKEYIEVELSQLLTETLRMENEVYSMNE